MFGEKRYVVLRVYCLLLKICSVAAVVFAIVAAAQSMVSTSGLQAPTPDRYGIVPPTSLTQDMLTILGRSGAVAGVAFVLVLAIASWALADYLAAHISIEENTREMVELMRQQRRPALPSDYPYAAPPPHSGLPRYEETPLGQYSQRQKRR